MADIFVSYAKADRSLASKLVAMLEAEGWSVWWDKSLAATDLYRDEIMKQLAAAGLELTTELIAFIISPIVLFARHRLQSQRV